VGSGDYFGVGERALALLDELAGLKRSDRVLDVGCGLGRLAWPLSSRLAGRGSYDGFDTARPYIDWCAGNLGLDPARFRFRHADIRTSLYNPAGAIEAERFRFPWPDRSFDLAIATSLFTHLLPAAARNYLGEIGRMLDRGGRLFASFFLLDERGRAAVAAGTALQPFSSAIEHGLVQDPTAPESAVAYDAGWLFETLAAAGFAVSAAHPGYWKGRPGLEYQDLVVAARKG
jgi:SAM-dependent methyltransferase